MRRAWVIALGVLAATAVAGAHWARRSIAAGALDQSLPGTFIADRVQPRGTSLRAWLGARRRTLAAREAFLLLGEVANCGRAGPAVVELTEGELGVVLDVEATAHAATERPTAGSPWQRLVRRWHAARGLEQVQPVFRVEVMRARATLERLEPSLRCEPVDARLDVPAHQRIAARSGYALDVGETLDRIAQAAHDEPFAVEVALREIAPEVTDEMLADVDVTHVLSAYETDFRGHAGARATNISRAARYLDGTLIGAGKPFSFNRVVGPRTAPRGFVEAPVIVADEMERGLGGGVCQVATTLHAAAVFGGLEVVERRSHSRPSGYAPIGLDATVVEDKVDLRLNNPYAVTLMVHAFLPTQTRLRVELLGREPPGKIEHFASVKERHPFCRRVAVKPELASDTFDVHQKGRPGLDVVSVVRTTLADGTQQSRSYRSKYWPVPEVVWVGPGFDLAKLPALPEGARAPQGDDDCAAPPQSP